MKKKIFGIFTFIVLMLSCISFSACGNNYDEMQFKISYAFTSDAEEWFEMSDDLILNYGGVDDELLIQNGEAQIYLKVEIENVKAKYIDDIIVSEGMGSTVITQQGEVFLVSIPVTQITTLTFY